MNWSTAYAYITSAYNADNLRDPKVPIGTTRARRFCSASSAGAIRDVAYLGKPKEPKTALLLYIESCTASLITHICGNTYWAEHDGRVQSSSGRRYMR